MGRPEKLRPADRLRVSTRIPGEQRTFAPGERVPLEAVIYNPTDREISFRYPGRWWIDAPLVVAHGDEERVLRAEPCPGAPTRHFSREVPAGSRVVMRHAGFRLGKSQSEGDTRLRLIEVEPGHYRVKILNPWRPNPESLEGAAAFRIEALQR